MITAFSVRNFKNLAAVPQDGPSMLSFGSLNVLIGPNGCGKSSLLQAIDFLRAFFQTSVEVYLKDRGWDYRDLPNLRQARKSIQWHVKARLDAEDGQRPGEYDYQITLQPRKHLGVGEEVLWWHPEGGQRVQLLHRSGRRCSFLNRATGLTEEREILSLPASIMSRWDESRDRSRFPEMLRFRRYVERFRAYLIWDPKVLRNPDRGKHDEIGPSGEHLASVLGRLKDTRPKSFRALVNRLKRLFPTLSDISVSGGGWGWRTVRLHEGNGREVVFNSQQMSDGILRMLAITTLLYLDHIPSVLTFEEPENGVHPQLIREVIQILRELTQRKPPNRCQVFMTTHSPYVLDEFYNHPEQVYCIDRDQPQAGATVRRLSENGQLKIAQRTFETSLGEAWTAGILGAAAGVKRL